MSQIPSLLSIPILDAAGDVQQPRRVPPAKQSLPHILQLMYSPSLRWRHPKPPSLSPEPRFLSFVVFKMSKPASIYLAVPTARPVSVMECDGDLKGHGTAAQLSSPDQTNLSACERELAKVRIVSRSFFSRIFTSECVAILIVPFR